jgi:hypothetical protein
VAAAVREAIGAFPSLAPAIAAAAAVTPGDENSKEAHNV